MRRFMLLVFFISNIVFAHNDILSIDDYMNEHPRWKNELSNIIYIGTRCGMVFFEASNEVSKEINNKNAEKYSYVSKIFFYNTSDIANNKVIWPPHTRLILEFYGYFYKQNIFKNYLGNDEFTGLIKKDLETCIVNYDFFEKLPKVIS